MNCEKCGSELEANAKFCTECGTSIPKTRRKRCQFCGTKIKPDTEFCPDCGNAVNADNGDSRVWECPGCSEQFTEEVIYCPKCGTKIAEKDWKSGLKILGALAAGMLIGSLEKRNKE